jgi:integrase/recombinase XerD
MPRGTATTRTGPSSGRSKTTAPAILKRRSRPHAVYKLVRTYSAALGFRIRVHSLRATAATNALDNDADIAKVQEWLGHSNRLYDHRRTRPEDSPTFRVKY